MNKKKIIILIIVIVTLTLVIIFSNKLSNNLTDSQIVQYLVNIGYKKTSEDVYSKDDTISYEQFEKFSSNNISTEYSGNSFNTSLYQLTRNVSTYNQNINSSIDMIYDYRDHSLVYNFRMDNDWLNIYYKGTYEENNFVCEKEFAYGTISSVVDKDICNEAKYYVEKFYYDAKTFFSDVSLVSFMEKQKIE